jgi:hypothetical protein
MDAVIENETDGGLSKFVGTYFNGRNLLTTIHGPGRANSHTNFKFLEADRESIREKFWKKHRLECIKSLLSDDSTSMRRDDHERTVSSR